MTLCLLVLGLGQANAQANMTQDGIITFAEAEFRTGANSGSTTLAQGGLDNSGSNSIKFTGAYESGYPRYTYTTQILTGHDGSYNYAYKRFLYSCKVTPYTRIKVGFANGQIHLYNQQTGSNVESAAALYIFSDTNAENTAKYTHLSCSPTAARPADPAKGQLFYYAYNNGNGGKVVGSTKYNSETYFDNSTGAAETTITKAAMLTTCTKKGPRPQTSYLLFMPVSGKYFTVSYEYFKHITYYANGGVGDNKNQTVSSASPSTLLPASTYTRKNHIFRGWCNHADGSTSIYNGGIGVNASNGDKGTRTLYAIWTPVEFTFKNGSTTVETKAANNDNTLPTLTTAKPTSGANQFFAGYYTQEGGKGIQVYDSNLNPTAAGQAHDFTSNTTLYAHFVSTQHTVTWDYTYRTGEDTYANLAPDAHACYCRLQIRSASGIIKTVYLTAPVVANKEETLTSAISSHTTATTTVTFALNSGSDVDNTSGATATIYFTQAELESIHECDYDVWSTDGTTDGSTITHWITETNTAESTTIFKWEGYTGDNMFDLTWTVTLRDLNMYPDKIFVKPMVDTGSGYREITPMAGLIGEECERVTLTTNSNSELGAGSSATYTGEYVVLKNVSEHANVPYQVGMTGFYLNGQEYFLNVERGTVANDFISNGEAATADNTAISYEINDYDIPVVLLLPAAPGSGITDATVNGLSMELYVDQDRATQVNLSKFVAERPHFNFLGWYDKEWNNTTWAANADYQFHTHASPNGGTRTLVALWQRDTKPEASVEMTEEANSFDYTITATDAAEVKAVKYMTADEEPAADATSWVVVEKNNDKYVVSIDRTNSDYGKYLYVMVENEGQYVIEKYEDPIRSFIDIMANPDPDSEVKMGHYEGEGDNAQWVEDDDFSYTYYSTYYNSTQAFKPVNATAYKVIAVNENTLRLANITTTENDGISTAAEEGNDDIIAPQGELILPKGEAVILQGSSAKITLELVDSDVTKSDDNKLEGVDNETAKSDTYNYYKLTYAQKGLGFYKMSAGDRLGANKAFFKKANNAQSNSVQAFTLNFGDIDNDLTAITIREMEATDNADTTFDLFGRKVSKANMQSGIYVNGVKKVIK